MKMNQAELLAFLDSGNFKEFAEKSGMTLGEYLQRFASNTEKVNAVLSVIGDKKRNDVKPSYVAKRCREVYGWKISKVAASHYLAEINTTVHICYTRGRSISHGSHD